MTYNENADAVLKQETPIPENVEKPKKKTKILVLAICLILVAAVVSACFIMNGIKVKNHDKVVSQIRSIRYLTSLINNEVERGDYEYLADFEDWSWHEDDENTLVYTLDRLEGDETLSVQFTFRETDGTLSRIWCNDMQVFVDFFLPAYKDQELSKDELSRIIRKELGLGVSVGVGDSFQVNNKGQYNNCVIEVNTYKVEYGEWFFGGSFSIESAE